MSPYLQGLTFALALLTATADGADLADPMRRPGARAEVASAPVRGAANARTQRWILQSTLVAAGRRSAVVNGRLVGPGEKVNGARVVSIDTDTVLLDTGARRLRIHAENPIHKKNRTDGDS